MSARRTGRFTGVASIAALGALYGERPGQRVDS